MLTFPDDYRTETGLDQAEDHIGPFYHARDVDGPIYAFRAEERHCNANGTVHGGVLMTFADFALCMAATNNYSGETCVTVSFNSEFVAAAPIGELVTCRVEVTRKARTMAFVRGVVSADDAVVLTFSAVVRRFIEEK